MLVKRKYPTDPQGHDASCPYKLGFREMKNPPRPPFITREGGGIRKISG
jgi:hypothetical protein